MDNKSRCDDLVGLVLDPQTILPLMPEEKVRTLLAELDMIMEDYTRDIAIMYIASNYSSKKHLCSTILRGKHDHEIKEAVAKVREVLVEDLKERKRK
ncbi:MAG: hypothetical protein LBE48_02740 [Methanomassiliicoccaceae archaeon]|jgi:hypothetical protein|nr:hypothetical protein [Methanomassiliicoccaceae archaeon]